MMPYTSASAKPKNTFLGQLTRRGFTWSKSISTQYPTFYQWSREVADHQRDTVLSPKAKAKKLRCSELLNDALGHPHPSNAVATTLPLFLPEAAVVVTVAAAAAALPPSPLIEAEAITDVDAMVKSFWAEGAPAGYESIAEAEAGLQSVSGLAKRAAAIPDATVEGLAVELNMPGLGKWDHGPAHAAGAAAAGLEDVWQRSEAAEGWSGKAVSLS